MLFSILRDHSSPLDIAVYLFTMVFVVFCTLPIHEFAHAWVATKLGDQTARLSGRLTINPIAHIDPIGAIMIFLIGFGYAKPVPVNPRNFKDPKKGMAITALAGPTANILMAFVFLFLKNAVAAFADTDTLVIKAIVFFLYYAALINISLAVFNLLPIPPLDGSRLFQLFIPDKYYYKIMQYERYIIIGVFILLLTGALSTPISFLAGILYNGLDYITALPFNLF